MIVFILLLNVITFRLQRERKRLWRCRKAWEAGGLRTQGRSQVRGEVFSFAASVLGDIWLLEHWLVMWEDPRMRLEGSPERGFRAA